MPRSYLNVATASQHPDMPIVTAAVQFRQQPPAPPNNISTYYTLNTPLGAPPVFLTLSVPNLDTPGTGVTIKDQSLNETQTVRDLQRVAQALSNYYILLGATVTLRNAQDGERTARLKCDCSGDWWYFWWQVVTVDVPLQDSEEAMRWVLV